MGLRPVHPDRYPGGPLESYWGWRLRPEGLRRYPKKKRWAGRPGRPHLDLELGHHPGLYEALQAVAQTTGHGNGHQATTRAKKGVSTMAKEILIQYVRVRGFKVRGKISKFYPKLLSRRVDEEYDYSFDAGVYEDEEEGVPPR